MKWLYEIFLRAYYLSILLAAPFNAKAKKWIDGRKKSFADLEDFAAKNIGEGGVKKKNIWVHCASVGEFEQGVPLIQKLEKQFPEYAILISFFSPSGYDYVAKKFPSLSIVYLPLDTKRNSKKWLEMLEPRLVIFVKYEFWHHYFHTVKAADIPLLMVSAIFWKELFFFKKYAGFFRKSLRQVTHFFVQDHESKRLLNEIGLENITTSGDVRFERVLQLKETPFGDEKIENFIGEDPVFIFGSVWHHDVGVIKKIISQLPTTYKFIIAPHEIDHFPYEVFADFDIEKYSVETVNHSAQILFLDTLGILSRVYRYAHAAYIGGGFGKGIHNILEAAVYNIPIFIGPNMQRFAEAHQLKKIGILTIFTTENEIENFSIKNLELSTQSKADNTTYFQQNTHATEDILVFIKKHQLLD